MIGIIKGRRRDNSKAFTITSLWVNKLLKSLEMDTRREKNRNPIFFQWKLPYGNSNLEHLDNRIMFWLRKMALPACALNVKTQNTKWSHFWILSHRTMAYHSHSHTRSAHYASAYLNSMRVRFFTARKWNTKTN